MEQTSESAPEWLDLPRTARVTVTSHTARVQFFTPMHVRRLRLVFSETQQSRTQEFTVWATLHRGEQHKEVVRQQFNFSPQGATQEVEEYATDLADVSVLEVRIVPSIDGAPSLPRLTEFRVAAEPA